MAIVDASDIDGIEDIAGPNAFSVDVPTLRAYDVTVVEPDGDTSSSTPVEFVLALDRAAEEDITFRYALNNGTATAALGDFTQEEGIGQILAGQRYAIISTSVAADAEIEGDENLFLTLTDLEGAVFEKGAAALLATATILDSDGEEGPVGTAGIGDPAQLVAPPDAAEDGSLVVEVVDTIVPEGDTSADFAYVYLTLSAPAPTEVTLDYAPEEGTATENIDYGVLSGTVTFAAGTQSTFVRIPIAGDINVEADETFSVVFSNPEGAAFADGGTEATAEVLIRDNDGAGTAGQEPNGPDFEFFPDNFNPGRVIFGTNASEDLRGGSGNDTIIGFAGNDTIIGSGGDDVLTGNSGSDAFAFIKTGDSGTDRITDFGGRDILALDDNYFRGLGGAGIDVRAVTEQQAQAAIRSGQVEYNRSTGELFIDDKLVVVIEGGPALTFEDVFLF